MSRRGSRTGEGKREAAAASGFVAPGTRVRRPEPASDLSRGLRAAAARSLGPEALDSLLVEALDALATLVPYELATLMELDGETLRVRVARGPLAAPEVLRHRLPLASFPSLRAVLAGGRAHAFEEHDHAEGDGDPFDGVLDFPHGHACMVVPLSSRDETLGLITLDQRRCDPYPPDLVRLADVFGKLVALVLRHGEQSELLRNLVEIMEEQNRALLQRVHGRLEPGVALESCRSLAMRELARLARQVAASEAPVLIQGETGTGKELLARAIHAWSPRAGRPLVTLNCAALPENLIESELFGHVKGAFTGATTSRLGRFQAADGGTLFLDEVGELPLGLQAKLLRVLQEGAFEPLGSDRTVRVDVRILAATNRDLPAAVRDRQFREDLFYRLAVFPLTIPPLRARPEDVAPLAQGILARLPARPGAAAWSLSDPALAWLESQPWPGNVRELVNALERATILARTSQLSVGDVGGSGSPASAPVPSSGPQDAGEAAHPAGAAIVTMEEMERRHIEAALTATGGRIYGADGAARLLGLPGSTLASRMKKLGLAGARARRSGAMRPTR